MFFFIYNCCTQWVEWNSEHNKMMQSWQDTNKQQGVREDETQKRFEEMNRKLILKSPRFVSFVANLAQLSAKCDNPSTGDKLQQPVGFVSLITSLVGSQKDLISHQFPKFQHLIALCVLLDPWENEKHLFISCLELKSVC